MVPEILTPLQPRTFRGVDITPTEGGHGHGILPGSSDSPGQCLTRHDSDSAGKTPEIIEIDPSLTNVPQNPIPAFSGMDGRWPKDDSMSILDRMRQRGNSGRFFGSSLLQDMINNDNNMSTMSVSPDAGQSSDRLTPNSSTSVSDRQQTSSSGTQGTSGRNSFDTSPASSSAQRNLPSIFDDMPGGDMPTGLTPGRQFGAPETPKNVADSTDAAGAGDFSWESFGASTGMTPMSEGVLRTMLQMGPMETMDLGWDNPP